MTPNPNHLEKARELKMKPDIVLEHEASWFHVAKGVHFRCKPYPSDGVVQVLMVSDREEEAWSRIEAERATKGASPRTYNEKMQWMIGRSLHPSHAQAWRSSFFEIDGRAWASVVASVSRYGETAEAYHQALAFHFGKDELFAQALAEVERETVARERERCKNIVRGFELTSFADPFSMIIERIDDPNEQGATPLLRALTEEGK